MSLTSPELAGRFFTTQFSAQSCSILCDPMDCSMPGFPVHHQLLEITQTHVHRVLFYKENKRKLSVELLRRKYVYAKVLLLPFQLFLNKFSVLIITSNLP